MDRQGFDLSATLCIPGTPFIVVPELPHLLLVRELSGERRQEVPANPRGARRLSAFVAQVVELIPLLILRAETKGYVVAVSRMSGSSWNFDGGRMTITP